jgi:hypothetical protein
MSLLFEIAQVRNFLRYAAMGWRRTFEGPVVEVPRSNLRMSGLGFASSSARSFSAMVLGADGCDGVACARDLSPSLSEG